MSVQAESESSQQSFIDPAARTRRLRCALIVTVVVTSLALLLHVLHYRYLLELAHDTAAVDSFKWLRDVVYLLQIIALLSVAALSLHWIFKACETALALGARETKFSPSWSVLWYFVPIANLWQPYRALQEIAKCSSNPLAWHAEADSPLLHWWWGLSLSSAVLALLAVYLGLKGVSLEQQQMSQAFFIAFNLLCLPLCVTLCLLTEHVSRTQVHQSGFALLD